MTDNNPKFTLEFGSTYLLIVYEDSERVVCYQAEPHSDMSAEARVDFLSSVKRWIDESSDCYTDVNISVLPHVIPIEQSMVAVAHSTP